MSSDRQSFILDTLSTAFSKYRGYRIDVRPGRARADLNYAPLPLFLEMAPSRDAEEEACSVIVNRYFGAGFPGLLEFESKHTSLFQSGSEPSRELSAMLTKQVDEIFSNQAVKHKQWWARRKRLPLISGESSSVASEWQPKATPDLEVKMRIWPRALTDADMMPGDLLNHPLLGAVFDEHENRLGFEVISEGVPEAVTIDHLLYNALEKAGLYGEKSAASISLIEDRLGQLIGKSLVIDLHSPNGANDDHLKETVTGNMPLLTTLPAWSHCGPQGIDQQFQALLDEALSDIRRETASDDYSQEERIYRGADVSLGVMCEVPSRKSYRFTFSNGTM